MQNKCLGVFLVFITIPLVMLSIINFNVSKLTTAKYYKELFKKSNSYELAVQALPKSDASASDDIIAAIAQDMTPVWLETNMTRNLDQFDAYFNGKAKAIDPSVDISAFKDDLTAKLPTDIQAVVPDVISFSTYTEYLNQTEKIIVQNAGLDSNVDQQNLAALKQQLQTTTNTQQQFFKNLEQAKQSYHLANIFKVVLYVLTILMLGVIALAARHWYPAIFRWLGQTLLISGLITLALAFVFMKIALGLNLVAKLNLTDQLKQLITPLYSNIFQDITFGVEKMSLGVAITGLIFVIASYILPKFSPEKTKPIASPVNN